MRPDTPHRRPGFTLVELLVAAALCVIIMYALATAFKAGTDTLSQLKSLASLAEQLRVADTIMRRDLSADHLEDDAVAPPNNKRRVSEAITAGSPFWNGTKRGFFKIVQPSQLSQNYDMVNAYTTTPYTATLVYGYLEEGKETTIPSCRAVDHWLHFTCRLKGFSQQETFNASGPVKFASNGNASLASFAPATDKVVSEWAEVLYFLARPSANPTTPPDITPTLPLYTLHRRIRVLGRTEMTTADEQLPANVPGWNTANQYSELALWQHLPMGPTDMVTIRQPGGGPDSVTAPANRLVGTDTATVVPTALPSPVQFTSASGGFYGNDILLTNVLSMQVQVLFDPNTEYRDVWDMPGLTTPGKYDTFNSTGTGTPFPRLRAVRITLRVYDPKNQLTRQITIAQAL